MLLFATDREMPIVQLAQKFFGQEVVITLKEGPEKRGQLTGLNTVPSGKVICVLDDGHGGSYSAEEIQEISLLYMFYYSQLSGLYNAEKDLLFGPLLKRASDILEGTKACAVGAKNKVAFQLVEKIIALVVTYRQYLVYSQPGSEKASSETQLP